MANAVADGDFPPLEEVDRLVTQRKKVLNVEEVPVEVEEEYQALAKLFGNSQGPLTRWHGSLLNRIDEMFKKCFVTNGKVMVEFGDLSDENYQVAWSSYVDTVVDLCSAETKQRSNGGYDKCETFAQRALFALDQIKCPFPTRSYLMWMDSTFKLIPLALLEVCYLPHVHVNVLIVVDG
jgi:hypothetical protein